LEISDLSSAISSSEAFSSRSMSLLKSWISCSHWLYSRSNACKKTDYSFPFTDVKKWLDRLASYQIFHSSPKHIRYVSYSRITKLNFVHQCDLIEIPYDDVNIVLLDNGPIFYYVLLVIDYATRYKDFIFLTSKSSAEVAEAFKSIYDNPDNPLNWPQKLQCDKDTEFMEYVTLLMNKHGVEIRRIITQNVNDLQ
ncbi:1846_t:CDS:2, partial [Funneliformis geosporum]